GGGGAIIASYTTQTTSAYQAPGGVIHLGSGDASFTATANANTAEANGTGVEVTAVGVTVLEITSQAGGTTEASVAGELHAGTLELSATSTNTATPTSTSVSVGAASGSGQITVAAVSAITNALVKSAADAHLSGAATLTATSTNTANPSTTGVNVSAIGANFQQITSQVAGSTSAGSSGGTFHGTTLDATAHSTNNSTATIDFVGVTVFGGNGVTITSDVQQQTSSALGGTIILSGAATLNATSDSHSTATNTTVALSVGINVSILNLDAELHRGTTARVADNGHVEAASLGATATGNATANGTIHFVGVSIVGGGSSSTITANAAQDVDAKVGTGSFLDTGSGGATFSANGTSHATADASNVSVSFLVSVGVLNLTAGAAGNVRASVGDGATVTAGSLTLSATGMSTPLATDHIVDI